MVVEPDEFVPFVLGEAVLVEEVVSVVPLAMDAEVENAHAEVVRDFGEVMFWVGGHERITNDQAPITKEVPSSKFQGRRKILSATRCNTLRQGATRCNDSGWRCTAVAADLKRTGCPRSEPKVLRLRDEAGMPGDLPVWRPALRVLRLSV